MGRRAFRSFNVAGIVGIANTLTFMASHPFLSRVVAQNIDPFGDGVYACSPPCSAGRIDGTLDPSNVGFLN
ncbi:hypothetical protein GCM10009547_22910 [Sporichthya brevicatena]|uniref:Uncharacterized protein n=1 Tax=Sporichthya brevicatena TaxID=171442 RepID=A0ABP3RWY1_9ACTN